MKISPTLQKILDLLSIGIAVMMLVSLPACASSSWLKQAHTSLPIETVHSGTGAVMSFRAHETSDRLYVADLAKPHQLMKPMHVDVQLIGAGGRIIAEKSDDLDSPWHPRSSSGRHRHHSYVASFPLGQARQAEKIRVVYHEGDHRKGNS
jgi:hypothetical protein